MNTNKDYTLGANATADGGAADKPTYRPRLSFYHANSRGTGSAMQLELHPAHDSIDGSIWAQFANQITVGDRRGPVPTYSTFDWEHSIWVKLDFSDLTKMLQVFRGESESVEDGKGLYHSSPRGTTRIILRHMVEPMSGYSMAVYRTLKGSNEETSTSILLSANEAYGLTVAIEASLGFLCFGIPQVVKRDTSEYRRNVKGMRDAPAA